MSKPTASLSLDLDNKWSYMKNNGAEGWEEYPSYLDTFVPYILTLLEELDLNEADIFYCRSRCRC